MKQVGERCSSHLAKLKIKIMTRFEMFLMDKGYIRFILNCTNMKFEKPKQHIISTMSNLDHRYIHKSETNLLDKINRGKSVMDEDFTCEDRKGEICFGLHEKNKPATLIYPRPTIVIQKTEIINGIKENIILTEQDDDAMNIILLKIDYEEILKAMYDKSICFELDLREKTKN
jgi:hypothetical protein